MELASSQANERKLHTWHGGDLLQELQDIIDNRRIETLFQPIFDFSSNSLFAYESLSRGPDSSPLRMPDAMFDTARRHGLSGKLDHLCRCQAMHRFMQRGLSGKLSINICPASLVDPGFRSGPILRAMHDAGLSSERVILELTEQTQVDVRELKKAVGLCRDMGFGIALDDLGAGYSNLRLLADLQPDYLKLDKYFISGVDNRKVEADFVRLIAELADRVGCKVIAEGIETVHELIYVRSSGAGFGQGYLLGKPQRFGIDAEPCVLPETARHSVLSLSKSTARHHESLQEKDRVVSLCIRPVPPCSPNDMLRDVLPRFQENDTLLAVPVLDRGKVVGLLTREEMLHVFSRSYAHSLYHRAAVGRLMSREVAIVQLHDSLAAASQCATGRHSKHAYVPLVVCDGDSYVGTLSIRALLEKITRTQVEHALHCNPLSGLPGNLQIATEVQVRLDDQREFVLAHFDLDNFKAYNDYYGFERGDQMIKLVAQVLPASQDSRDFVGHIGGDDFVMLFEGAGWESQVQDILDAFRLQSALLYDESERDAGFIETQDRAGNPHRFPLASLSVSAVFCHAGRFRSHLEAAEVVAEVKHESKKIEGNSLVVDRRRRDAAAANP